MAKSAKSDDSKEETRLNLVYKGRTMKEVLDRIQDLGHHGTVTDAVATAIRMYEGMLKAREEGRHTITLDKDGGIPIRLL